MQLVSETEAPAEVEQVYAGVAVGSDATNTSDAYDTCVEVGETSSSGRIDGLGKDDVPTDTVVEGESRSDAPAILRVKAAAVLPVGCGAAVDVEGLELRDLAFEDRADARPCACAVAEDQQAGAVGVAGIAQIEGVTQVRAEADGMVAVDLGPVVVELQD